MHRRIILMVAIGLSACHTLKVVPVNDDAKLKKEGIFYYLPKTKLVVDVTVKETRYMKGPFTLYSAKFTGISNVITENKTEYILENIEMSSLAVPDTSKLFYLYTNGIAKNEDFLLRLDEYGCILGLNCEEDRLSGSRIGAAKIEESGMTQGAEFEQFEHFATGNTQIKTDTIIEKIILDTITIEKQILQHRIIEKSLEDKAKDAADYISLISENKMNLIAGYQEVDYDITTFNTMLGELDKILQDYLNLFTGKSVEYIRHYRFIIEPDHEVCNDMSFLFSFDNVSGVSDGYEDTLFLSDSYYYKVISGVNTVPIDKFNARWNKSKNKGLAYNIPEECTFIISKGLSEIVFSEKIMISQLGVMGCLPASMKHVGFNPADGSVLSIEK